MTTNTAPPKQEQTPYFLWLDLETTGLDDSGRILEVAAIVTDFDLKELGRRSWVLGAERNEILPMMNDYVIGMHLNSGLLAQVWESQMDAPRMTQELLAMAVRHCKNSDRTLSKAVYLAGSSIAFDRRWMEKKWGADILGALHYRMVDVSVYKTMFPGLLLQPEGGPAHRAMADVEYSLDQQRQMSAFVNAAREAGLYTVPPHFDPKVICCDGDALFDGVDEPDEERDNDFIDGVVL